MKNLLLASLLLLPLSLTAGADQNGPRKNKRPPKEAVDACKDKASGDTCSFESPHGKVSGTCWAPRTDLPLACKPTNHRR